MKSWRDYLVNNANASTGLSENDNAPEHFLYKLSSS
jgi:hypothetical protein